RPAFSAWTSRSTSAIISSIDSNRSIRRPATFPVSTGADDAGVPIDIPSLILLADRPCAPPRPHSNRPLVAAKDAVIAHHAVEPLFGSQRDLALSKPCMGP